MAGLPGSIPSMLPAGQDELVRRMRDLERRVDELGPSVAKSFIPMLATVVKGGQAGLVATAFPVTTTTTAVASATIAVPPGFTTAIVFASAHGTAFNTTAISDLLYVGARITGWYPAMIPSLVAATSFGDSHGSASRIFTGLSGGSIGVDAMMKSEYGAWGVTTPGNAATIDAIAIFYR
jgi:hypothetical protein